MKRKVLCMLLTGILSVSMLAGCGTSGEDTSNDSGEDSGGSEESKTIAIVPWVTKSAWCLWGLILIMFAMEDVEKPI